VAKNIIQFTHVLLSFGLLKNDKFVVRNSSSDDNMFVQFFCLPPAAVASLSEAEWPYLRKIYLCIIESTLKMSSLLSVTKEPVPGRR
jgi:hypothetical protein